ncbi:hypothetical protein DM02DRAFT_669346 [Periconia macrospinosa]|uniref:N-acetyltransferase domain-containing protein n=1 Tax=Periconia macrospinosa TaxID=97972 RepID=A0A2V1E205_9PLEO|nr:hypothetical protein DM02DRAFT_669346 [Periconia macrospinosa]
MGDALPPQENGTRARYAPDEIILSEATKDDLTYLAEGYYASFDAEWHDEVEPPHLRPENWTSLRVQRLATRMTPWFSEPNVRIVKATLSPSSSSYDATAPNRIIGQAMWLLPSRTKTEIVNFWRRDASDILGWREKMGWTKEFEDELWSSVDLTKWQDAEFLPWDRAREEYLGGIGHWFLGPIWVLPEHQGRGLSSMLLKNASDLADKADPPEPLYLEAFPDARVVYLRHGYQPLDGVGKEFAMIRNPPESLKPLLQKPE